MAKVKENDPKKSRTSGEQAPAKKRERGVGTISSKNQLTLPVAAMREAGFKPGDRIRVQADPSGEIRLSSAEETPEQIVRRLAERAIPDLFPPNFRQELKDAWPERW